jgi:hypothetical protein
MEVGIVQLRIAVTESQTLWKPRGRVTSAVGSHYWKTGEDTAS